MESPSPQSSIILGASHTMPTTLKVWSFHKSISRTAREDLLKHFGATTVQHVGRQGRDGAVLASFKNEADCNYALRKLHQQELLGVRLKAVYKDAVLPPPTQQPHRCKENTGPDDSTQEEMIQKKIKEFEVNLCSIAPALGISHPIPPTLRYLYPPPSASVIANIAQALTEVPKFYTQVLHLMNKMNLPTPFQPVRYLLPIHQELLEGLGHYETQKGTETTETNSNNEGGDSEDRMDNPNHKLSESESELESEGEGERSIKPPPAPTKRRLRPLNAIRKRPKLSLLKQTCVSVPHSRPPEVSMRDVFEVTETQGLRRLELRLKDAALPRKEDSVVVKSLGESGSFGKMESLSTQLKDHSSSETMVEWQREADKYIKKEDILNNRVAKSEWPILPVFKNYTLGEPSVKLYIKNLAKATTEKDLKYIFGRYVFWQNEEEASLFSICLMKEGRMKGQAFITFPSVKQASEALQDTNGFILNDKPMVVAFGRVKKEQTKDSIEKE